MTRRIYEIVPIGRAARRRAAERAVAAAALAQPIAVTAADVPDPARAPQPPRQPRLRRCLMMPRRLVMFGWDGSWSGSAGVPLLSQGVRPNNACETTSRGVFCPI